MDFLDHMRRPITASERVPGPYPYFGANGQQDSVVDYIFDDRLVLLAEDGGHFDDPARGIAYRIEGRCWVNNHAHVLRPRPGVDWAYLALTLRNADVRKHISGTTRAKLTKAGACAIRIPLPPIEQQRRIAAILDKADEVRAKRQSALANHDSLTHAIFLDMFGDRVARQTKSLGELGMEFRYGTSNKSAPAGFKCLRIPDVVNGAISFHDLATVPVTSEEAERLRLKAGDLVFVRSNGNPDYVGRCAACPPVTADEPFIFASYLIRGRLPVDSLSAVYVQFALSSPAGRRQLRANASTSAGQYNINTQGLRAIRVAVPPLAQQLAFERAILAVRIQKDVSLQALDLLGHLESSLQQRVFAGAL